MIETYAEYGAVGVIVSLFVMMIVNLMKSQKAQNEDLNGIYYRKRRRYHY